LEETFFCDCGSGNLPGACTLKHPHGLSKQQEIFKVSLDDISFEPLVANEVAPIETVGIQLEVTTDQTNQ